MTMVFTRGMSRPDSMIEVVTSTSYSCARKAVMTFSSLFSGIWPWATQTRAWGSSLRSMAAMPRIVSTRLCTKKTCPPRLSSRRIASLRMSSLKAQISVWMGRRSRGGVVIRDMSRAPISDRYSVRGMGVAVSVSTSTSLRSCLSRSLWRTPKRCSSSTTTRPSFANLTSRESSRWVPISTSRSPSRARRARSRCSTAVWKRLSTATRAGKSRKRSAKVSPC